MKYKTKIMRPDEIQSESQRKEVVKQETKEQEPTTEEKPDEVQEAS